MRRRTFTDEEEKIISDYIAQNCGNITKACESLSFILNTESNKIRNCYYSRLREECAFGLYAWAPDHKKLTLVAKGGHKNEY